MSQCSPGTRTSTKSRSSKKLTSMALRKSLKVDDFDLAVDVTSTQSVAGPPPGQRGDSPLWDSIESPRSHSLSHSSEDTISWSHSHSDEAKERQRDETEEKELPKPKRAGTLRSIVRLFSMSKDKDKSGGKKKHSKSKGKKKKKKKAKDMPLVGRTRSHRALNLSNDLTMAVHKQGDLQRAAKALSALDVDSTLISLWGRSLKSHMASKGARHSARVKQKHASRDKGRVRVHAQAHAATALLGLDDGIDQKIEMPSTAGFRTIDVDLCMLATYGSVYHMADCQCHDSTAAASHLPSKKAAACCCGRLQQEQTDCRHEEHEHVRDGGEGDAVAVASTVPETVTETVTAAATGMSKIALAVDDSSTTVHESVSTESPTVTLTTTASTTLTNTPVPSTLPVLATDATTSDGIITPPVAMTTGLSPFQLLAAGAGMVLYGGSGSVSDEDSKFDMDSKKAADGSEDDSSSRIPLPITGMGMMPMARTKVFTSRQRASVKERSALTETTSRSIAKAAAGTGRMPPSKDIIAKSVAKDSAVDFASYNPETGTTPKSFTSSSLLLGSGLDSIKKPTALTEYSSESTISPLIASPSTLTGTGSSRITPKSTTITGSDITPLSQSVPIGSSTTLGEKRSTTSGSSGARQLLSRVKMDGSRMSESGSSLTGFTLVDDYPESDGDTDPTPPARSTLSATMTTSTSGTGTAQQGGFQQTGARGSVGSSALSSGSAAKQQQHRSSSVVRLTDKISLTPASEREVGGDGSVQESDDDSDSYSSSREFVAKGLSSTKGRGSRKLVSAAMRDERMMLMDANLSTVSESTSKEVMSTMLPDIGTTLQTTDTGTVFVDYDSRRRTISESQYSKSSSAAELRVDDSSDLEQAIDVGLSKGFRPDTFVETKEECTTESVALDSAATVQTTAASGLQEAVGLVPSPPTASTRMLPSTAIATDTDQSAKGELSTLFKVRCQHFWTMLKNGLQPCHLRKLNITKSREVSLSEVTASPLFEELCADARYRVLATQVIALSKKSTFVSEFIGRRHESGICWEIGSSVEGWAFTPSHAMICKQSLLFSAISSAEPKKEAH